MKGQGTRIDAVMETIRSRIASRAYPPGARLPSVRAQAQAMRLSVSTVVEAYERLAAEGAIRSRPGSGFYVSGPAAPLALSEIGPKLDREVDPLWISRQSLETGDAVPKPGCGWLPPAWMYEDGMRRALRAMARADAPVLADYGTPLGLPPLRQLLARRMAATGIEAAPEQIMLTDSGTQAIDLICRFLLEPGDTVLVDDPCYFNFHALLKAHRAKAVGIPYTPNGPDVAAFEAALREHAPRLYITNSAIHNPTGATLSPQVAHRLLNAAGAIDMAIVEDEIVADFEPEPSTRLAALDGLSRVIRIGSYSKTLSASARCGYIAARPDWIEGLVDLQIATNFGGPNPISAEIIAHMLSGGGYRKHMEELRRRLVRVRRETVERLQRLGIEPWLLPRGGFNLWCRLPEGLDSALVAQAAVADGVVLAPGNVFSISQSAAGFMRFNVAHMQDPRVYEVLARAMR